MNSNTTSPGTDGPEVRVDFREQLYNDGLVGPARDIQLPAPAVTRLNGILLDVDPGLLLQDNTLFPPAEDPRRFSVGIEPVLARHPLARHAEVRASGTGLHLILRIDPPVELRTSADQRRWSVIVRAVQGSLPSDPNAPGITALTRPIGSINSKNGAVVEVLRPGQAITPDAIVAFVDEMAEAPFRSVALPLLGSDRIAPCPACLAPSSSLGVLDRKGECYHCGDLSLEGLFGLVFAGVDPAEPAGTKAEKAPRGNDGDDGKSASRQATTPRSNRHPAP